MIGRSILVVLILVVQRIHSAPKCDLKSIFRTPEDGQIRNFDHFEILERSNFDEDVPEENSAGTVPITGSNPRSYANAQVLLRFGNDKENKGNIHHHNFFYPNSHPQYSHPCLIHPVFNPFAPPVPFMFPNYFYYPNCMPPPTPGYHSKYMTPPKVDKYFVQNVLPTTGMEAPGNIDEAVKESPIEKISSPSENALTDHLQEKQLTRIENKDHPKILKPLDLTDDKIKSNETPITNERIEDDIKTLQDVVTEETTTLPTTNNLVQETENSESITTFNTPRSSVKYITVAVTDDSSEEPVREKENSANDIEELLKKALVPINCYKCDQKRKLLVSYPIVNNDIKEEPKEDLDLVSTCPYCTRRKVEFGKRFPVDVDDLTSIHGKPVAQSNILQSVLPQIISKIMKKSFLSKPIVSVNEPNVLKSFLPKPIVSGNEPNVLKSFLPKPIVSLNEPNVLKSFLPKPIVSLNEPKVLNDYPIDSNIMRYIANYQQTPSGLNYQYDPSNLHYQQYPSNMQYYQAPSSQTQASEPKIYYSGYQMSSGSSSYSDPTKIVYYQQPTRFSMVTANNQVQPEIEYSKVDEPSCYKVIPKYNIVPKYNVIPLTNYEKVSNNILKHILEQLHPKYSDEQAQLRYGSGRYCSSCAKYTGELNE